ncbi:V-type ATP synthase subunit F [Acidaminobacterium chupaoyuni]
MYKAAVIGDSQTVIGFRAIGLAAYAVRDGEEAARCLHRLARESFAVIYITEQLAVQIPQEIARYDDTAEVAVIPIPSKDGMLGIGRQSLHSAVERAVGADILKEQSK